LPEFGALPGFLKDIIQSKLWSHVVHINVIHDGGLKIDVIQGIGINNDRAGQKVLKDPQRGFPNEASTAFNVLGFYGQYLLIINQQGYIVRLRGRLSKDLEESSLAT